jgi:hypothetical protein
MPNLTLKNVSVEPPAKQPYSIFVCLLKSSALLIGNSNFSTVKNAAKLAVYDANSINVKTDQAQLSNLVEGACGLISIPVL